MAKQVVDRLNGSGTTLAGQQDFQTATNDRPSNRFGTVYVNLRQLESLIPADSAETSHEYQQLIDLYPTGVGYGAWTDVGVHASVTLHAAHSLGVQYPTGNTTALAKLVPANTYAYVSVGNLGGSIQASQQAFPGSSDSAVKAAESFL